MNKKITDEELVEAIYKYVGEHICFPDYKIIEITTYVQGDYIYNIIKYAKDNKIYSVKTEAKWKDDNNE